MVVLMGCWQPMTASHFLAIILQTHAGGSASYCGSTSRNAKLKCSKRKPNCSCG